MSNSLKARMTAFALKGFAILMLAASSLAFAGTLAAQQTSKGGPLGEWVPGLFGECYPGVLGTLHWSVGASHQTEVRLKRYDLDLKELPSYVTDLKEVNDPGTRPIYCPEAGTLFTVANLKVDEWRNGIRWPTVMHDARVDNRADVMAFTAFRTVCVGRIGDRIENAACIVTPPGVSNIQNFELSGDKAFVFVTGYSWITAVGIFSLKPSVTPDGLKRLPIADRFIRATLVEGSQQAFVFNSSGLDICDFAWTLITCTRVDKRSIPTPGSIVKTANGHLVVYASRAVRDSDSDNADVETKFCVRRLAESGEVCIALKAPWYLGYGVSHARIDGGAVKFIVSEGEEGTCCGENLRLYYLRVPPEWL